MKTMEFNLSRKDVLSCFLLTAVFNAAIALFLTHMDFGSGFRKTFILSQAIGLSICAAVLAGHRFVRNATVSVRAVTVLGGIALGTTAGAFLGSLLAGTPFAAVIEGRAGLLQMLLSGLFFGIVVTYFFISREKIAQTEAALHAEQIKRLTLEKTALESRLRVLQAQIEPHFLFNSLSNIMSLLDGDPARGKCMLANLAHYLRATLSMTREETGTLEREMDLVRAFLEVHKVRMGERLRYTIEFPGRLRDLPLPPMLVQPLVENAVKHGLEPKIEGGEISIRVAEKENCLILSIADTGTGFHEGPGGGVGLANVRDRLELLYDGRGRLVLEDNEPSGLKATIEIPHAGR